MIYYHYAELIHKQAEKYRNRTALKYRDDATGKWQKISWIEFAENIRLTAEAMADSGIEVQENIGVYSQNMPQCLYTYFGAYANRVVDIPMYATSSPSQIAFIVEMLKSVFYLSASNCNTITRLSCRSNFRIY